MRFLIRRELLKGAQGELFSVRRHYRRTPTGKVAVVQEHQRQRPTYFASGSNHPGELRALVATDIPAGATVGDLTDAGLATVLEEVAEGDQPFFLDSGAFRAVKGVPKPVDWDRVMDTYRAVSERMGSKAYLVAPDKIGNWETTRAMLQRFHDELTEVQANGANLIVGLQGRLGESWGEATALMGTDIVAGIPANKSPKTPAEVYEFVRDFKPARVHLLGLGWRSPKAKSYIEAIERANPGTKVSLDSVAFRAHVGQGRGIAEALGPVQEEHAELRRRGYTEADRGEFPGEGLPDYTDAIAEPSAWMTRAAQSRVARAVGLERADRKAWMSDPDEFLQLEAPNGEPWYAWPDMEEALEAEYDNAAAGRGGWETAARKERSLRVALPKIERGRLV